MLIFVYFILVKFKTLKYFIENKNSKKLSIIKLTIKINIFKIYI